MKRNSNMKLVQKQKMAFSGKAIFAGSVLGVVAAGVLVWNFTNSSKSMASNARHETIKIQASSPIEETSMSTSRTETISQATGASSLETKAASATISRSESKSAAMGMASEEQALDAISRQLSENGKDYAVMMENPEGKVNMAAIYTYSGRPDLSEKELEDLRNSNKPGATSSMAAPANMTASTDASPDLGANVCHLRKFEVVNPAQNEYQSVKLVKFDGRRRFNNVLLSWNTAGERYSDYFAIEKSVDGKNFREIGRVNGAGDYKQNLLYSFLDRHPEEGAVWYRVHQYDFSGNDKVFAGKKIK